MLVVLNFDAASKPLVDRLVEEGRLPTLAALREQGAGMRLRSPGDRFPASAYPTLYTGLSVARTGHYYPFQWVAGEQRVRVSDDLPGPRSIWDRLADAGRRVLVVDPYEARKPARAEGLFVSGWQFRNHVVLPPWSIPDDAYRRSARRFGRAPAIDEVFGTQSASSLLRIRHGLLAGPRRAADLALDAIAGERFDLVWLSFPSVHLAGHQFWDFAHLPEREREHAVRGGILGTLEDVYEAADAGMGRTLSALPGDADVCVFSALGMTDNTSRSDLLPGMLEAVLGPRRDRKAPPGSSIWRLRAAVPREVRAGVARALPRGTAIELTARLEGRVRDWSRVRAFSLPSDAVGYVRLNVRGRERDGIVEPGEIESLIEEIRIGLLSFTDPDGTRCVDVIERTSDALGADARLDLLPDLLVRWSSRPSATLRWVVSPQFGEVTRHGGGSGRSGNHNDEAWAVLVPGRQRVREPATQPGIASIPATVLAALGLETDGIDDEPLLG
jgi:predicted AlkP superfamily phosphohydrolase/phosphomutase